MKSSMTVYPSNDFTTQNSKHQLRNGVFCWKKV